MRDHIKLVNTMLNQGNYARLAAESTATGTIAAGAGVDGVGNAWVARYTVGPVANAAWFNIGDTVGAWDAAPAYVEATAGGVAVTVVGRDTVNGYVYTDGALNFTAAAGDTLYVLNRVTAPTSVWDVPMADATQVAGGRASLNIYNLTTRAANGYAAGAVVSANAGVARDINLKLLDDCIDAVRERGGLMGQGLILTGFGQYSALDRLLQAQQRYIGYGTFQFGVGDERTYPGTQVGMELASYRGIPILPDADVPKGVSSTGTALGHDVCLLDLDHLELGVAISTQYFENQNYFVANALVVQGLLFTAMELRARRIDVHARITDLSA